MPRSSLSVHIGLRFITVLHKKSINNAINPVKEKHQRMLPKLINIIN